MHGPPLSVQWTSVSTAYNFLSSVITVSLDRCKALGRCTGLSVSVMDLGQYCCAMALGQYNGHRSVQWPSISSKRPSVRTLTLRQSTMIVGQYDGPPPVQLVLCQYEGPGTAQWFSVDTTTLGQCHGLRSEQWPSVDRTAVGRNNGPPSVQCPPVSTIALLQYDGPRSVQRPCVVLYW